MSTQSRARNQKRPTPVSGSPRLFGKIAKSRTVNLTAFQDIAHKANKASSANKTGGAFGGVTKATRKIRNDQRNQPVAA